MIMPTHISEILGLRGVSHKDIDFVDIVLESDTKLFIDPCLIKIEKTEWMTQAQRMVCSYFDRFYDLYSRHASDDEKLVFFEHVHEINATRLGYGNGHNGKAKTPQGMLDAFRSVSNLLHDGIALSQASDLVLFIRRFAEDCLSDMLTNIIYKALADFTLEQCIKYGKATQKVPTEYYYWSDTTAQWEPYQGFSLLVNGNPILLVPKSIVRHRYYFTVNQFFTSVILTHMQDKESWIDGKGKLHKLTKKALREKYQGEMGTLDCAIQMTKATPEYLLEYHRQLPLSYAKRGMLDEELDAILY